MSTYICTCMCIYIYISYHIYIYIYTHIHTVFQRRELATYCGLSVGINEQYIYIYIYIWYLFMLCISIITNMWFIMCIVMLWCLLSLLLSLFECWNRRQRELATRRGVLLRRRVIIQLTRRATSLASYNSVTSSLIRVIIQLLRA